MSYQKFLHSKKSVVNQIFSGIKKITLFAIVLVLFIVVIIPLFLSFFLGRDTSTINDSNLILGTVEVANQDNAYLEIKKIEEVYEPSKKENKIYWDILTGGEWQAQIEKDILEKNKKNYKIFDTAVQKNSFAIPSRAKVDYSRDLEVIPVNYWRQLSRIVAFKALSLSYQGKSDQAIKETLKLIKLGHMIESSQCTTIEQLVGLSVKLQGIEAFAQIISDHKIPNHALKNYLVQLEKYDLVPNDTFIKMEYMNQKLQISRFRDREGVYRAISRGETVLSDWIRDFFLDNKFYFKTNKTLEIVVKKWTDTADFFSTPCTDLLRQQPEYPIKSLSSLPKLYFTDNVIGKIITYQSFAAFTGTKRKRCENQSSLNALRIKIATKMYLNDTGNYPRDLNELSGEYLKEIPLDVFTGREIEYDYRNLRLKPKTLRQKVGQATNQKPNPVYSIK